MGSDLHLPRIVVIAAALALALLSVAALVVVFTDAAPHTMIGAAHTVQSSECSMDLITATMCLTTVNNQPYMRWNATVANDTDMPCNGDVTWGEIHVGVWEENTTHTWKEPSPPLVVLAEYQTETYTQTFALDGYDGQKPLRGFVWFVMYRHGVPTSVKTPPTQLRECR